MKSNIRLYIFLIAISILGLYSNQLVIKAIEQEEINLDNNIMTYSEEMSFAGMYPGDSISKSYIFHLKHTEPVHIYFETIVKEETKQLSDELKLRITTNDLILYDGSLSLAKDITQIMENEQIEFTITVYADKTMGNEYQNAKLLVDYHFYLDEKEIINSVNTADKQNHYTYLIAGIVSLILIFLIKGRNYDEQQT